MNKVNYRALLESPEWRQKREIILDRDNHTCQHCSNNKYRQGDFIVTTFFRHSYSQAGQQWIQSKEVEVNITQNEVFRKALQVKPMSAKRHILGGGVKRGFASYKLIKDKLNNTFCEIYAAFSLPPEKVKSIADTWDNAIQYCLIQKMITM